MGMRLTKPAGDPDHFLLDASQIKMTDGLCTGPAVDRLASFENAFEALKERQIKIATEMEALRTQGKTSTVSFRQLLAEKLLNQSILVLFRSNGLD